MLFYLTKDSFRHIFKETKIKSHGQLYFPLRIHYSFDYSVLVVRCCSSYLFCTSRSGLPYRGYYSCLLCRNYCIGNWGDSFPGDYISRKIYIYHSLENSFKKAPCWFACIHLLFYFCRIDHCEWKRYEKNEGTTKNFCRDSRSFFIFSNILPIHHSTL